MESSHHLKMQAHAPVLDRAHTMSLVVLWLKNSKFPEATLNASRGVTHLRCTETSFVAQQSGGTLDSLYSLTHFIAVLTGEVHIFTYQPHVDVTHNGFFAFRFAVYCYNVALRNTGDTDRWPRTTV
jgi:hypothetical protein